MAYPTGTSYWHTLLIHPTGTPYWYNQQVLHPTATSYEYYKIKSTPYRHTLMSHPTVTTYCHTLLIHPTDKPYWYVRSRGRTDQWMVHSRRLRQPGDIHLLHKNDHLLPVQRSRPILVSLAPLPPKVFQLLILHLPHRFTYRKRQQRCKKPGGDMIRISENCVAGGGGLFVQPLSSLHAF